MRIPEIVRKCVVYLGIDISDGPIQKIRWCGTGFFVHIPSKIPHSSFLHLVTAKHVEIALRDNPFYIRANTPGGESITANVKANEIKWWNHSTDTSADVAVSVFSASKKKMDYSAIPSSSILTEQMRLEKGFGAGDDVFITGLFAHHAGNTKNIPIIRMGNIAMIPDEPILTSRYGSMDAYLIEVRSIGGLSGSPVFVVEHAPKGKAIMHLLGLIHGHWDVKPETIIDAAADSGVQAGINVGIAMVVPAQKIIDTLNCDGLVAMRQKAENTWLSKHSATPD